MISYWLAPSDFGKNLGLALEAGNMTPAQLARKLNRSPDKASIGRWLKGKPSRPRSPEHLPKIEKFLEVTGLTLPFDRFLELNRTLDEYHRMMEAARLNYPSVRYEKLRNLNLQDQNSNLISPIWTSHEETSHQEKKTTSAESDTLLFIRPESLLKPLEITLRESILQIPYFILYHDMNINFQWDPCGFVRLFFAAKYAIQNRMEQPIDYRIFGGGLWNVRGEWIDSNSAITKVTCHCPNLPSDLNFNFELTRPEDLLTYEIRIGQSRRIERPVKIPSKETLEVITERTICGYAVDQEPIFVRSPTGRLSMTVDVTKCPGLHVRAAPLHSLPDYFHSIPGKYEGVFQWNISTGLLPQQGLLLWWQGTPPNGSSDVAADRRLISGSSGSASAD